MATAIACIIHTAVPMMDCALPERINGIAWRLERKGSKFNGAARHYHGLQCWHLHHVRCKVQIFRLLTCQGPHGCSNHLHHTHSSVNDGILQSGSQLYTCHTYGYASGSQWYTCNMYGVVSGSQQYTCHMHGVSSGSNAHVAISWCCMALLRVIVLAPPPFVMQSPNFSCADLPQPLWLHRLPAYMVMTMMDSDHESDWHEQNHAMKAQHPRQTHGCTPTARDWQLFWLLTPVDFSLSR